MKYYYFNRRYVITHYAQGTWRTAVHAFYDYRENL